MNNMSAEIVEEFLEVLKEEGFTLEGLKGDDIQFLIRNLVRYSVNKKSNDENAGGFLNDLIQKINDNK
jgi:hypothetical protein